MKNYYLPLVLSVLFFTSCKEDKPLEDPIIPADAQALFVLNEGLFLQNNSTLGLLNLTNNVYNDQYFNTANNRGIGDTGNDLKAYGSKLYAVINNSGQVEVIRKSDGVSIQQVSIFDGSTNRQPRTVDFYGASFYVANFDGTIQQFDTTNFTLQATRTAGRNPDGLAVEGNKLYVSNSGGLDFPNFDNTISVFSLPDFTLINTIEVGLNPGQLVADGSGGVYVSIRGNYGDVPPSVAKINSDNSVVNFAFEAKGMAKSGNDIFVISSLEDGSLVMRKININTSVATVDNNFSFSGVQTVNRLSADNVGNLYVSDVKNYISTGDIVAYSNNGIRLFTKEVGLNPNAVVRR